MKPALLSIKNFSAGYGDETVLEIESLDVSQNGIMGLLGPSGSGKSTLFSAITCQVNNPSYWQKGVITLNNTEASTEAVELRIGLVAQKARLYTGTVLENFIDGLPLISQANSIEQKSFAKKTLESLGLWSQFETLLNTPAINQSMGFHKLLLIARIAAKRPQIILLDEPLADTSMADEPLLIELIQRLKKISAVVVITHNKEEAKKYCDYIALISGGVLHEVTPAGTFFKTPKSNLGERFLQSGSAWHVKEEEPERPSDSERLAMLRRFSSLTDFFWVKPEMIAGMQKPGLLTDVNEDLAILQKLGVKILVSLTTKPIHAKLSQKFEITGIHFPIIDMGIPGLAETKKHMEYCGKKLDKGSSIVFHCRAGMGRTGIMLACMLIYQENMTAIQAIEHIRKINHRYIQTDEQFEFVSTFEKYLLK